MGPDHALAHAKAGRDFLAALTPGRRGDYFLLGLAQRNILLHRARTKLAGTYHRPQQPAGRLRQADQATRLILARYGQAWEAADVVGLVALSREEAVLAMPPGEAWYARRGEVGEFLAGTVFADEAMFGGPARGRWRLLPCAATGEAGFGLYRHMSPGGLKPLGLSVISPAGP